VVGLLKVVAGMRILVPATPHMPADQANPQVSGGAACLTARRGATTCAVSTHWTRCVTPLLQALPMKLVVAHLHACTSVRTHVCVHDSTSHLISISETNGPGLLMHAPVWKFEA
jgi:hypothetical protein